jgi:hypothetical protein
MSLNIFNEDSLEQQIIDVITDEDVLTETNTATVTNKDVSSSTNTFPSNLVTTDTAQNISGAKVFQQELVFTSGGSNSARLVGSFTANRTVTIQDASDTIVCRNTTDTLTNKTLQAVSGSLAAPSISFGSATDTGFFREANRILGSLSATKFLESSIFSATSGATFRNQTSLGHGAGSSGASVGAWTAIGANAGNVLPGNMSVAIGYRANETSGSSCTTSVAVGAQAMLSTGNSITNCVAVGYNAGAANIGSNCTFLGARAGADGGNFANCVVINAANSDLNPDGSSRCFINPIRGSVVAGSALFYNTSTKEISYNSNFTGDSVVYSTASATDTNTLTTTSGSEWNAATLTLYWSRTGNIVCVQWNDSSTISNPTTGNPQKSAVLPAGFRPVTEVYQVYRLTSGGAASSGIMRVTTAGSVVWHGTLTAATNSWTVAGTAGIVRGSISFLAQ